MDYDLFVGELPKPLTNKEMRECFINFNDKTREMLITHNIRLVINQVTCKFNNTGCDQRELVSIGVIGLIKAIDNFDINKGKKFSSFACVCICNEIFMYLRSENRFNNIESLSEVIYRNKGGEERFLESVLEDTSIDFVNDVITEEENKIILEIINSFDNKKKRALSLYFGFNGEKPCGQRAVAKKMKVSQPCVSRMLKEGVLEIRDKLIEMNIIDNINKEIRLRKHK